MSKDEKYRQLADQCLMEANRSDNRRTRAVVLHMAEEWLRLADQERSTGPARVDRSLRLATASPVEAGLRELIAEAEQQLAALQERRQES